MKYIKQVLIISVLIGLTYPVINVSAQTLPQQGNCTIVYNTTNTTRVSLTTYADCAKEARYQPVSLSWAGCTFIGTSGKTYPAINFTETSCKTLLGIYTTYSIYPTKSTPPIDLAKVAEDEAKAVVAKKEAEKTQIYQLLAPLPCESGPGCVNREIKTFDATKGLGSYLNLMIKIFIGLCAVLSVVMIVVGGLEYMTSELVHTKEAGKERITQAILGLLIALGAYALLFTINPYLLKSDVTPPDVITKITPRGLCTFKSIEGNGEILSAYTIEESCKLNGKNFISWKEN